MDKDIRAFIGTRQERAFDLRAAGATVEDGCIELAFSSEEPYERYFGIEVLDHSPGAVRLKSTLPLCKEHDTRVQLGLCEDVRIDGDRRGRAKARFSQRQEAQDELRDITDGIRGPVSVGYIVHEMKLSEQRDEGPDVYLVTDWEPVELSMVTVPADATVGVGRSAERSEPMENVETPVEQEAAPAEVPNKVEEEPTEVVPAEPEIKAEEPVVEPAVEAKSETPVVEIKEERKVEAHVPTPAVVGLSNKETRNYSVMRLMRALASPNDNAAREAAAFEFEVGEAAAKAAGRDARGIFVPNEVLTRDLTAGTTTAGGYLVGTDHMAGSFIELLRNKMVCREAGATVMDGLVDNVAIPTQTGGSTFYMVAESGAVTESNQTVGQKTLTSRTGGTFTDLSRKLLKQSSPSAEQFVIDDLTSVCAIGVDNMALNGSGASNQPTGVVSTSGIGTVTFTSLGAPTFAEVVDVKTQVATDNALRGKLSYVCDSAMAGHLETKSKDSGSGQFILDGGKCAGYPLIISEQMTTNTLLFGNFADLIIGFWGNLDLLVDPYTGGTSGTVRVLAHIDFDVAVRHAESFALGSGGS